MRRLFSIFCCCFALVGSAIASDISPLPDAFGVSVEREPTSDPVFRAFMTVRDNKFTFIIPGGYSTGGDPAHGKLSLKQVDGGTFITFGFVSGGSSDARTVASDSYRGFLSERYPSGKIVNEFTRPAGGRVGTVFDVEWKTDTGLGRTTRAIYFQTAAGVMEITISCDSKHFPQARNELNGILTTFTASADGKLHFTHFSDGSA